MNEDVQYDVAVLGVPIDTAVSYRPGARFGPRAIRQGSARQTVFRSFNPVLGINPYLSQTKFMDCGDVPVTPFDNALAFRQIEEAYDDIIGRPLPTGPGSIEALPPKTSKGKPTYVAKDGKSHPRVALMGGDHSVALPVLRSLNKVYGHRDNSLGFTYLETWEMDKLGTDGVVEAIKERVGDTPVYLSIDIDVLDPSIAPGTGTPVSGGLTSRELRSMVRMLKGLNLVGCEVVEVSPPYDSNGEVTALAAAELLYEMMSIMALRPLDKKAIDPYERPPRWEPTSKDTRKCACEHGAAPTASSSRTSRSIAI